MTVFTQDEDSGFVLKAGPVNVRLVIDESLNCSEGLWGEYDPNASPCPLIRMAPGMTPKTYAMTMLHELLHHIDEAHGLGLKEWQVRCLEQGISSLVVDNPAIAAEWFNAMILTGEAKKD